MNIEQRLAALEAEVAEMKVHQTGRESMSKMVQKVISDTIKKSLLPGGLLHGSVRTEKAALTDAAYNKDYHLKTGVKVGH